MTEYTQTYVASRAIGDKTDPTSPCHTSRPDELRYLGNIVSSDSDIIAYKAKALHDLPKVLFNEDGSLRKGTTILDESGNFHKKWAENVQQIREKIWGYLEGNKAKSLNDYPEADIARIVAAMLIQRDVPKFARAVITQDELDKQNPARTILAGTSSAVDGGRVHPADDLGITG